MVKTFNAIHTRDTNKQVKKGDYNTKIDKIEKKIPDHDKYITTQEVNKLTADNFTKTFKQADLSSKTDVADFIKKSILIKYFKESIKNYFK